MYDKDKAKAYHLVYIRHLAPYAHHRCGEGFDKAFDEADRFDPFSLPNDVSLDSLLFRVIINVDKIALMVKPNERWK